MIIRKITQASERLAPWSPDLISQCRKLDIVASYDYDFAFDYCAFETKTNNFILGITCDQSLAVFGKVSHG